MKTKIQATKDYIESVIDWWSIPQGMYSDYEDKRIAAHEAVVDVYECNPADLQMITDNLEIWIDLPLDRGNMPDITDAQINQYSLKLHNILESEKFKEDGYTWVCDETKRLRDIWYDK